MLAPGSRTANERATRDKERDGNATLSALIRHVNGVESTPKSDRRTPALTIVVPTRNEAENINELLRRLAALTDRLHFEVLFVDDSDDQTPAMIEMARPRFSFDVRVLHRSPGAQTGRLGGAVVAGLREAQAPWVCVMDADLQHPPELIPALVDRAAETDADLVVASRYCADGQADSFGFIRSAVSQASTSTARLLFPRRLRPVSDPMSGFFLVRRGAVDVDRLRPCGFKILLEIIGRTKGLTIAEAPFEFGERHAGESKASLSEGLRYLQLLLSLRFGDAFMRFTRFGLVGLSGLFVNMLLMIVQIELLGIFCLLAAVVATQGSTLWNFALTERWVFVGRVDPTHLVRRAAAFFAMSNASLALRGPAMLLLTSVLGMHYALSNLLTLVAVMVIRFTTSDRWIWGGVEPTDVISPADLTPQFAGVVPAAARNEGT